MRYLTKLTTMAAFNLTLLAASCGKHETPLPTPEPVEPITTQDIQNCHYESNPQQSQITDQLVGEWLWMKRDCPFTPDGSNPTNATKQVIVKFTDAGGYTVTESTKVIAQGTWSLSSLSNTEWVLELTNPSEYTYGVVYICENQLLLMDSYRDGCDHLYERQ